MERHYTCVAKICYSALSCDTVQSFQIFNSHRTGLEITHFSVLPCCHCAIPTVEVKKKKKSKNICFKIETLVFSLAL